MNETLVTGRTLQLARVGVAAFGLLAITAVTGCASGDGATDESASAVNGDSADESGGTDAVGATASEGEALSAISCSESSERGYRSGNEFGLKVVRVDGKLVEVHTADAYFEMAKAAAHDGVNLSIVSGFRTMAQQQYLYGCYIHQSCNGGNLAAVPGYSNHQSGHAVDLNTSSGGVYSWLENHAGSYGFRRTVPSEIWHWEWWGGGPGGGPCAGGGGGGGGGGTPPHGGGGGGGGGGSCHSSTLSEQVPSNACVQSRFDRKWYQCDSGRWVDRFSDPSACTSVHPL